MFETINLRALSAASVATLFLVLLVLLGSRGLVNFDAALVAYLFGTLFACFGITYRYAVWIQRPPTKRFFVRGWRLLGRRLPRYVFAALSHVVTDILIQRFIWRRSPVRGLGHSLMALGCMLAFAVTFPLVFGWVHFTLLAGSTTTYVVHLFGFSVGQFAIDSLQGHVTFNALNISAVLVIAGVMIMMRRRFVDAGLIALQTFEGDWLPLLVLLAVSVTGLGVSLDYHFMAGRAHPFMAITHATTVILFLVWIPFGKFYHIVQRPAQVGAELYKIEGAAGAQQKCVHSAEEYASEMHIKDLKDVTAELGFDFSLPDGTSHLDRSPRGKRAALATAHLRARTKNGGFFG